MRLSSSGRGRVVLGGERTGCRDRLWVLGGERRVSKIGGSESIEIAERYCS